MEPITTEVEEVDLAESTSNSDSEDSESVQDLEERKQAFREALATQLLGFHGCGSTDLEEVEHQVVAPEGSLGLEAVIEPVASETVPYVLGSNKLVEPGSHATTAESWQKLYTGYTSNDGASRPPVVSLLQAKHTYNILQRSPKVQWDVDSILAFPTSLAFAKRGLVYLPNPQITANLNTDIHLTMSVPDLSDPDHPKNIQQPLHKVPHYCLGRVNGFPELAIFLFFPRLYNPERDFTRLSDEDLQRWTDRILLPAIYEHLPAGHTQHLPASWQQGVQASLASGYEKAQKKTGTTPRQQPLGFTLQAHYLNPIWRSILHLVREPGHYDFSGVQLFLSGKNLKMAYKHRMAARLHRHMEVTWTRHINTCYINDEELFIDIGKETVPPDTFLEDEEIPIGAQPQVYLWRRCCLKSYVTWFRQACSTKAKESSMSQLYFEGFLQEAAQLTVLAPRGSIARQVGLVYSQFYASSKEMFDSAKTYPFANDRLEALAIDPVLRKAWAKKGNAEAFDSDVIQRGYLHSKLRCHRALVSSLNKSFGTREEHRLTWKLWRSLIGLSDTEGHQNLALPPPNAPPLSVWVIPSELYIQFLMSTINKFAAGFEHTLSRCRHDLVSWEHTKVMCMFLRCLRFCLGGQLLERESALWWNKRRRMVSDSYVDGKDTGRRLYEEDEDGRFWQVSEGMGLEETTKTYQYGWLMNKIDWNTFIFKEDNGTALLFGNKIMMQAYRKHRQEVIGVTDDFLEAELVDSLLKDLPTNSPGSNFLQQHLVWLCIRLFRKDVFTLLKPQLSKDHASSAMSGTIPLCMALIDDMLDPEIYIAGGGRTKYKDTWDLVDYFWDLDDGIERRCWVDKPYRLLYKRCRLIVHRVAGSKGERRFVRQLKRSFVATNWMLPSPCSYGFWQKTKKADGGHKMWIALTNPYLWDQENPRPDMVQTWAVLREETQPENLPHWVQTKDSGLVMWCQPQDDPKHRPQSRAELEEAVTLLQQKERRLQRRGELGGM